MFKKVFVSSLNNSKPSFLKNSEKTFTYILHEHQGQSLLKKYDILTPKVLRLV